MQRQTFFIAISLALNCCIGTMLATGNPASTEIPVRPAGPSYVNDDYGPLPFPEEVTGFILHEIRYLLRRQNEDGSWNSAQPMGYGKTSMEAGGTVDKLTLTSMCGYSLRKYPEYLPQGAGERISRARDYVSRSVKTGTLKVNVQDAPWRYVYILRFLADEYARTDDVQIKADLLDTCTFVLRSLERMQFRMRGAPVQHLDDPRLPGKTIWIAKNEDAAGGWGYLTRVKGSSTFLSADALRELLAAKAKMPELQVQDALIDGPFIMLSKLRKVQPNTEVPSYRYDAAGSFWKHRDLRADVGRLAGAELACLLYSEREDPPAAYHRTHTHLELALQAWLDHRAILDRVKFPGNHGPLSIAPWFWVYSYRTTLEAAAHLKTNPSLQAEVQHNALRGIFRHMVYRHEPKLGEKGWIIGGDLTKELHDTCQLLDGLATMKHVFGERVSFAGQDLEEAAEAFRETRYGEAFQLLNKAVPDGAPEKQRMQQVIETRLRTRLSEVVAIHEEYPYDGLKFLEAMHPHFNGYPGFEKNVALAAKWRAALPELPPWHALGAYPGDKPEGTNDLRAWGRVLTAPASAAASPDASGFENVDPSVCAIHGTWQKIAGQLIVPHVPNARLQLPMVPQGSYSFEAEFTRINGDCLAVMFPVGNTSALLVVGGWGGKVSGLAFVDGKDADRNPTTRDGSLRNGVRHTIGIDVNLRGEAEATLTVQLDGTAYLEWKGLVRALRPDRAWKLRDASAIGLGGYNAHMIIHRARLRE